MAVKVKVELDCEKLREQLREVILEIMEDIARNDPVGPGLDLRRLSPSAQQIARDIGQLIYGSPTQENH